MTTDPPKYSEPDGWDTLAKVIFYAFVPLGIIVVLASTLSYIASTLT